MYNKNNQSFKNIKFIFLFLLVSFIFFTQNSFADAVIPKSSWIIKQEVYVTYYDNQGNIRPLTFTSSWTIYNWAGDWGYKVLEIPGISETQGPIEIWINEKSLLSNWTIISNLDWTFIIDLLLTDQADNISYNVIEYRKDSTAPSDTDFKIVKLESDEGDKTVHTNEKTVYFKDWTENFTAVLEYWDNWNEDFMSWINIDFLQLSWSGITTPDDIWPLTSEKIINAASLNRNENTTWNYELTICDNAYPIPNCLSDSFTWSRDNTDPSFLFENNNWSDLYDSTTTVTWWFSKFIKATDDFDFEYTIEDDSSWVEYKFYVEKSGDPSAFTWFLEFSWHSTNNSWTTEKIDLSLVDNDLNSSKTYRLYSTKLESNWTVPNQICDNVNNCIPYDLTFRVISNSLDNDKSTLKYEWPSLGKIYSNNNNKYKFEYSLKDKYSNKIVPIQSNENNWTVDIKKVTSTIDFTNTLYQNLSGTLPKWSRQAVITNLELDNSFTNNINDLDKNIIIVEDATDEPNWKYSFSVKSKVPTYDYYPYISDNTKLTLDKITNKIEYPDTGLIIWGSNLEEEEEVLNILSTNWPYLIANSGSINEDANNQNTLNFFDNSTDKDNYWKYTFSEDINSTTWLSFTDLISNEKEINFSFASPFVYGLKDFNILIDGQWIWHIKKLFKFSNNVTIDNVTEKILVSHDADTNEQISDDNKLLNYKMKWDIIKNNISISNIMDESDIGPDTEKNVEIFQSWIPWKTYDTSKLKTWFASKFTYEIGWTNITLPSIWRNIIPNYPEFKTQYTMSRNFFADEYTIWTNTLLAWNWISDIWINWLVNSDKTDITYNNSNNKGSVNITKEIWWKLSRYSLLKTFKKNVNKYSRWTNWCKNIASLDLNSNTHSACTRTISWEKVTFIEWDLTIECSWWEDGNTCIIDNKRTIIVKNWKVIIKSNITTKDKNKWQLLIWNITDQWLQNFTWTFDDSTKHTNPALKSWTFIDEAVTNIDAFIVSQWPVVSYSESDLNELFFTQNNLNEKYLRNQLYIYGSIISLNNIWGSKKTTPICPYIIGNCNENISQVFDLIYLRRYMEVPENYYPGETWTDKVPYHPTDIYIAKKSWFNANLTENTDLRKVSDNDKNSLPLIIERDKKWDHSPSLFTNFN